MQSGWILSGLLCVIFCVSPASSAAASPEKLPGCETAPAVRHLLQEKLGPQVIRNVKYPERLELQKTVLGEIIARYPREWQPYADLREAVVWGGTPEEAAAQRAQWVQRAHDHEDDPLFQLLAGWALSGHDTPEAIRLMQKAHDEAPNFPRADRELAWIFLSGKHADAEKSKQYAREYFALCPASESPDYSETALLRKDIPLMQKTTVALRARLAKQTDSKELQAYKMLWSREFLTHKLSELDAERTLIKADLQFLQRLHPHPDAAYQDLLNEGARESGASEIKLKAMQNAIVQAYPQSEQAEAIVRKGWYDAHPSPKDATDAKAWRQHNAEVLAQTKQWRAQYPDDTMLQRNGLYDVVKDDPGVPEADGVAAVDIYLQAKKDYKGAGMMSWADDDPSGFLLNHGWQPKRALDLLKETSTIKGGGHAKLWDYDNLADKDRKNYQEYADAKDQHTVELYLRALATTHQPALAEVVRAAVESPAPTDKILVSGYWHARGLYAALENDPMDAMTYYQLALNSRKEKPTPQEGVLRDDLQNDAHTMWTAQGGTETAWSLWNKPQGIGAGGTRQAEAASEWKIPDAPIPDFELSDFSGKTWRLKDLRGKTVLISSWATWCGPCKQELPHLQKLYEKVNGRQDLQIITLNIDENPGQVQPFLREQHFTFPVLAATSMEEVTQVVPQIWIIDQQGHSRWLLTGFDDMTDDAYQADMLDHIQSAGK